MIYEVVAAEDGILLQEDIEYNIVTWKNRKCRFVCLNDLNQTDLNN